MPTTVMNNLPSYQNLHHQPPNYQFLKVFSGTCYPLLKSYNPHKRDFHSQKRLFLGYSPLHNGYKYLTKWGKVYITIHIHFNEFEFSYSELFPSSSSISFSSPSSISQSISSLPLCVILDSSSYQSPTASPFLAVLPTPSS